MTLTEKLAGGRVVATIGQEFESHEGMGRPAFAQIDLNQDGAISADELAKFLKILGHKVEGGPKAIQDLIKAADEGAPDCKLQVVEFVRLYNGLKLDAK